MGQLYPLRLGTRFKKLPSAVFAKLSLPVIMVIGIITFIYCTVRVKGKGQREERALLGLAPVLFCANFPHTFCKLPTHR
jgi:hypothetical protein